MDTIEHSEGWTEPVDPPKKEFLIVDNARFSIVDNRFVYPFDELNAGQGFFVSL